jgi:hypothetical protein
VSMTSSTKASKLDAADLEVLRQVVADLRKSTNKSARSAKSTPSIYYVR